MPTLDECCTLLTYHLRSLARRLKANDETLTVFEPWTCRIRIQMPSPPPQPISPANNNDDTNNTNDNQQQQQQAKKSKNKIMIIPFSSIYLEDSHVQKALRSCFAAFNNNSTSNNASNTSVTTVHLYALAQPELTLALSQLHGLRNLQHLRLSDPTKSHSLSCQVVTEMLQKMQEQNNSNNNNTYSRLKSLETTTRLAMHSQEAIDALSAAFLQATTSSSSLPSSSGATDGGGLQTVSLALLPRTNPQSPSLNLDSLVQAFTNNNNNVNNGSSSSSSSNLQSLHWTIGYQHNPYQQPLVKIKTMQQFFQYASPSLQSVHFQNLGLTDDHLIAMAIGAKTNYSNNNTNSSNLHTLVCLHNPRITSRGLYAMHDLVCQCPQLQTVQFLTRQEYHSSSSSLLQWQSCCHNANNKDKTSTTTTTTSNLLVDDTTASSSNNSNSKHVLSPLLLAHKAIQLAATLNQRHWQDFLATTTMGNVGAWLDTVATTTTTTTPPKATTTSSSSSKRSNEENVLNIDSLALDLTFTLLRANPSMMLGYNRQEQAKCCTSPAACEEQESSVVNVAVAAVSSNSSQLNLHPWLQRRRYRSGKKASLALDLATALLLLPAPPLFAKQQQQRSQDDSLLPTPTTTTTCSSSSGNTHDKDDDDDDDSSSLSSIDSLSVARRQQSNNKKDIGLLSDFMLYHTREPSPPIRRIQQQQQNRRSLFSKKSDYHDNEQRFKNVVERRELQRQLLLQQQQQQLRRPPRRGGRRLVMGDAVHVHCGVGSSLHVSSALC